MALIRQPIVLLILDGWGVASPSRGNAINLASTPVIDRLVTTYPTATLQASGEAVGVPWGEVGNSEVGHMNIGAGKIIFQDLPRITRAVAEGSFFKNPAFVSAAEHVRQHKSTLHIVGLASSGGVHSSIEHLYALLEFCVQQKVGRVAIHPILDGRDTPHDSGQKFIQEIQDRIAQLGIGQIASLSGRFYALDRDNHWDRTSRAFAAMAQGKSDARGSNPASLIEQSYVAGVYDEEFVPAVITDASGQAVAPMLDGDAVIFFNYRNDRPRQLTKAFVLPGFEKFDRGPYIRDLLFVTMTEYEQQLPVTIAFPPERVATSLTKIFSDLGLKQLHIAETEKYAHVTFFLNGGTEAAFPHEERALIPSPPVTSYDKKPEMSAHGISERLIRDLATGQYAFIVANFANADMVGHTGNIPATIKAIETLDHLIGDIADAVFAVNGVLIITADHGNAEEKIDIQRGFVSKEHTANPVPFIVAGPTLDPIRCERYRSRTADLSGQTPMGILADVAPTLLALAGIPKPSDMTGQNLFPNL